MGEQIYPEPTQAKKNSGWRNFAILCLACSLVPIVVMMCSQISGPVGPTIPKAIPARYVAKPDAQLDAMTLKEHMTVIRAVAAKGDNASDNEMLDAIDHARSARKTS